MNITRRLGAVTVAAALVTLSMLPAAPGTAAGPAPAAGASLSSEIPEDCTVATIDRREKSLTCTDRPATQRWHLNVACFSIGFEEVAIGNTVTGNGTSNARCNVGFARNTIFVIEQ